MCGRRAASDHQVLMPEWVDQLALVLSSISLVSSVLFIAVSIVARRYCDKSSDKRLMLLTIFTWIGASDILLSAAWIMPNGSAAGSSTFHCYLYMQLYFLGYMSTSVWTIAMAWYLRLMFLDVQSSANELHAYAWRLHRYVHVAAWLMPLACAPLFYFDCLLVADEQARYEQMNQTANLRQMSSELRWVNAGYFFALVLTPSITIGYCSYSYCRLHFGFMHGLGLSRVASAEHEQEDSALGTTELRIKALLAKVSRVDRNLTSYLVAYVFCHTPPTVLCNFPAFLANALDFYFELPWQVMLTWFISQPLQGFLNAALLARQALAGPSRRKETPSAASHRSTAVGSVRHPSAAPSRRSVRHPSGRLLELTYLGTEVVQSDDSHTAPL